MKRILLSVDAGKWYHKETLKKFYKGYTLDYFTNKDSESKEFNFVSFRRLWTRKDFVEHPKTKRLSYVTLGTLDEIGWK